MANFSDKAQILFSSTNVATISAADNVENKVRNHYEVCQPPEHMGDLYECASCGMD